MKDTSGAPVLGRTSWKRLGIVMVPTLAAAGTLTFMISEGAIAASFAVSGTEFKLSADQIQGTGFVNYGSEDHTVNGTVIPVAVSAFQSAQISGLCQSVVTSVGGVDLTLTIKASTASAQSLIIDMTSLSATTAEFYNGMNIGQDASTLGGSASGAVGQPGMFGQQAGNATLTGVQQVAYATTAGTFTLNGMSMDLTVGNTPCF